MEPFEPNKFELPYNWVHDPQTKCYTNLDTRATLCYIDEMFGFIDPLPNQTLLKDCHTNLETENKLCAKEEPFDFVDNATAAMETVPKQCHTNLETADKFCAKEEPFDFVDNATAAMETVPKQCHTNLETVDKFCAKEEPFDFVDNATAAMETVSKQKDLPLRLYFGNGPRIHRQLCIEAGVVNKRCDDCGQVGQLTCFSSTFRKWALKRVTEEELNQICSRCHERGHNCLNCDIPIINRLVEVPVPKEKKTVHCGRGGKAGHT